MKYIGVTIFTLCQAVLFVFELIWFYRWWGIPGVILGFVVPPLVVAFPFIHLAKESLSQLYLGLWIGGLVGALVYFVFRPRGSEPL